MTVREWCQTKLESGSTPEWFVARSIKLVVELSLSTVFGLIIGFVIRKTVSADATVSAVGVDISTATISAAVLTVTVLIWSNVRCGYP